LSRVYPGSEDARGKIVQLPCPYPPARVWDLMRSSRPSLSRYGIEHREGPGYDRFPEQVASNRGATAATI